MEGTVDTDGNILNADIGFRIKAGGKIISKKFTLIDEYYSLWKLQQPDYKGYKMLVHEACAYSDYVVGEIHTISDNQTDPGKKDTVPYQGALKVLVKHPNNQINEFSAQTNEKGIFAALNIPLKKGDQVMVKLPDVSSPGPAVPATIPFKEISLYAADYYAGVATGSVAGTRSDWSRLVNQQAKGQTPANVKAIAQSTPATNLKGMMPASQMAERFKEFRNNLTVYRGPVEFITQTSAPAKAVLVSPGVRNLSGGETEKVKTNRGNVNNPLGMFTIEGLVFEPGQKVKARIEVEGFIIESEWIETEGLLVSEIEHEQFQFTTGIRNENYSAQNSFIVVSSLRSQTAPAGKVQLLKGADVQHGSVTGFQSVSEFTDVKKAKLWFNQTVDLKPLENYPGSAIAETGPWNATVEYSSPGDVINPLKNRKHPFELVSYQYKNQDLGYKVFINQCASCTSPANVVEKLGGTQKSGIPVHHQQQKAPAPREAPVLTPKVNPGKMR